MPERKIEKIPARTKRYIAVMAEAAKRAKARTATVETLTGKKVILISISDIFDALCYIHPESFSNLLGCDISLPEVKLNRDSAIERFGKQVIDLILPEPEEDENTVYCHSAEVDMYLSPYGGYIDIILSTITTMEEPVVDSLHIAAALLIRPIPEVENILAINGFRNDSEFKSRIAANLKEISEAEATNNRQKGLASTFENIAKIREYLLANCFGQENVIKDIITQLSIVWGMPPAERNAKPLSFFFVGAPGTGKSHMTALLQNAFETILAIPKITTIDFSRFATEQLPIDLIGRDSVWKDGGHEGILTGAAAANPQGIIVIENYERGHACAVSYLDGILETGFAFDEFTKKNVCFSKNIFVILTHKKEFAESDEFLQLVSKDGKKPPRDKIVEGLVKFEPGFHSTLRLVDTPILFHKHNFNSFFQIIKNKLSSLANRFTGAYDAVCEFESENLYQLLVEMHPNVISAHPIISALETAILIPLQDWLLHHYDDFAQRKKIRIVCDTPPDFEGAPERSAFHSFEEWLEARTKRRILQAKRLIFNQEINLTSDAVELHMKNISYVVIPNIEDAGYFAVTVPDVSFSDLVGVDLVRERISEVIDYFNNPAKNRVRPDTGIVLYGPPGTGKTSVAKAIAKELGVPFIMAMGADFLKPHQGEGVESVKKLFAAARRYGAVVFIDEIDGIGSRGGMSSEVDRIINAFLTELDGFRERNMLVIGATNRYDALDEALVRPGRLSLKIQLGLLHRADDRRKLIEEALNKVQEKVSAEIITKLVETTNSWSPANLTAMVNGGVRLARRANEEINFSHFVKARTIVMLGEDPQQQEGSAKDIRLTAVHEAGHAVTAVLRGIPFVQATIQGVGSTAGFVEHLGLQGFSTAEDIAHLIDMCLGGRSAEDLLAEPSNGVQSDFEHATRLAADMIKLGLAKGNIMAVTGESTKEFTLRHRDEIEDILQERMKSVQKLLLEHQNFLKAVAEALETQKLLFEADILSIKANMEEQA